MQFSVYEGNQKTVVQFNVCLRIENVRASTIYLLIKTSSRGNILCRTLLFTILFSPTQKMNTLVILTLLQRQEKESNN